MVTPLLDLPTSTRDAHAIWASVAQQAIAVLKARTRVDHDFLDKSLRLHPRALLWPRIIFDKAWFETHGMGLQADGIASCLAEDTAMQTAFHYHRSARLFTPLHWALPEDFVAVDVASDAQKIGAALQLVSQIWPEAWTNIHAYANGIVWFSSQNYSNFSDVRAFGSIFLRPDVLEKSLMEIATLLIHETAHHVLFGEFLRDPLLNDDPNRRVYSPLRRTERPIHGVFQSLGALVRMIIWLHQVLAYEGPLDPILRAEAAETCNRYQNDLGVLVNAMRDIRYTEQGQRIFADFVFVRDNL